MTASLSQDRYCYPGSNQSCVTVQFTVGTDIVLYVLIGLGMLITIVGNSAVIFSVACFKHMHKPTNVFILSLSLVDLLVGTIVIPFSSIRTVDGCWFYGEAFCLFHSALDMFLTTVSIFHLVCIAVDRYQAICNPMHYSRKMTMPVAWTMVFASWSVAAVYAFGLLYSKANVAGLEELLESMNCLGSCNLLFNTLWGVLESVISFFFPCILLFCLYGKIFFVAKRHAKKIHGTSNCGTSNNRRKYGLINQSERKAAKSLSIVVSAFIFCWSPFFVSAVIDACPGLHAPIVLFEAFVWLGYLNSTLNPIIYALFYPCFRKCIRLTMS